MTKDPEAATGSGQYEARLLVAGASGLRPADIEELAVVLDCMDAKIRLLRRRASTSGGDFGDSPVAG